jgi:hypothetical protein
MPRQIAANWKWCFTLNNYTEVDVVNVVNGFSKARDIMYFFRKEIGAQGTPHLQGLVWCTRRTSKGRRAAFRPQNLVKSKSIHWERLKSSVQQHVDYCGGYGDHSEKSGTGTDVFTNMTSEWESIAQREARALKVREQKEQKIYKEASEHHTNLLWAMRLMNGKDRWSDDYRKGLKGIRDYMEEQMIDVIYDNMDEAFWYVMSWGECQTIDDYIVWLRQWDEL